MKRGILLAICLLASLPSFGDKRNETMNVLFAVDTSLSMRSCIAEAKMALEREFAPLLIPGDRVSLISFDEKPRVVYEAEVPASGPSSLIAAIRRLEAKGPFTDIGAALDFIYEKGLGMTANGLRLYALLITDERQESPIGSKYADASSFESHQLLRFVLKDTRDAFSIITLGIGYGDEISGETERVDAQTSAPGKPRRLYIESLKGEPDPAASSSGGTSIAGSSADGSAAGDVEGGGSGAQASEGSDGGNSTQSGSAPYLIIGAAIAAALIASFFVIRALRARRRSDDDEGKQGAGGARPS